MTTTPPTEQQLDEITAIAARAAEHPFYVSDCEGSLQVWREEALVRVARDESGQIEGYSFPSTYKVTDQIIELDLSTWDPGEDATDDQQRQDIRDLVEARAALGVLLAEIDRQRTDLAAAEAAVFAAVADELEGIDFHPDAKAVCTDLCRMLADRFRRNATPTPAPAPLDASHSPAGDRDGETATEAPETLLRDAEHYLSALHGSVARHDNLAANYGCAGCELRDAIRAQQAGEQQQSSHIAITRSDLAALLAHHADVLAARWRAVAPGAGAWEVAAALSLTSHANELSAETERPAVTELLDNILTFLLEQQAAATETAR